MFLFLCSVIICDILMFVSSESPLEMEVAVHLSSLESQTYYPITSHMSLMVNQVENIITNFTHYEEDSLDLITDHAHLVREDIQAVYDIYQELGGVRENCEENIFENSRQTFKGAKNELRDRYFDGINKAQGVINEARDVFMAAQNYTLIAKMTSSNCRFMSDYNECLIESLQMILIFEQILPKIIAVVGRQHMSQISLIEQEVIGQMEGIVVRTFDKYVAMLDEFLMCILNADEDVFY